jgi:hypothetical protein
MARQTKAAAKAEVVPSLDDLKAQVSKEHNAALVAARTTIAHAIRAGEALLQIRAILMPKGEWTQFIDHESPIDRTQGYRYMRLAQLRELIPPTVKSITEADELLKGLPSADGTGPRTRVEDLRKEEAQEWRAEEPPVPYKEIARRLGLPVSTVHNWFKPRKAKRDRASQKAEREREEQRAIRRLAAKNDTALSEAYATAERMRDILGQARREATTPEAKAALKRAEEYHHVTRDSVVEALKEEA